ncbi:unnamed protein product [Chrysoparadoxa australica]
MSSSGVGMAAATEAGTSVVAEPLTAERIDDIPADFPGEGMAFDQGLEGDEQGDCDEYDDEDDASYEDPVAIIQEMGHHPMMDRIQETLFSQLLKAYTRVSEELRDKENDLKRVKNKRESVGVVLYTLQQQLARLQVAIEQMHEGFGVHVEGRAKAELELDNAKESYQLTKQSKEAAQKLLKKNQAELNAIQETLRQVETYNDEMKGEILVTRRATYKAEASVQELEKAKGQQDAYIDGLMDQVRRLQEDIAVHNANLASQDGQTGNSATEILRETAAEMSLIAFEKKQLVQQWRSALVTLEKRGHALSAAQSTLKEAEAATRDYDIEIEGIKREILVAQAKNETLVGVRDRLEGEGNFLGEQIDKIRGEKAALAERFTMLQRSLQQTSHDEKKVDAMDKSLDAQGEALVQQIAVITRQKQKLELEAAANRGQHTTATKAVKNIAKQTAALVAKQNEVELEEANVMNELARIKVDALNTEAHNQQLKETHKRVQADLEEKDLLIEKYQLEIRQRHDDIEKKMYRVDRLNRKYEQLMEGQVEPESSAPLEASVKNIQKEIAQIRDESSRMKHEWLQQQTQLVGTVADTEENLDKNREMKARVNILGQKKMRLLADIKKNQSEVNRLDATIRTMHMDMSRLNSMICSNTAAAGELANSTGIMEREFIQELKELERNSAGLTAKIRDARAAKAEILDEIIEMERQMMLWEKKIQLERETMAALSPDVGKSEVANMEKEIHRMRMRHDGLAREQEKLIQEMERAVLKHEQIAIRNKGKVSKTMKRQRNNQITKSGLKKKVMKLQKEHGATEKEIARYEAAVAARRDDVQAIGTQLTQATQDFDRFSQERRQLQNEMNAKLYEKQRRAEVAATKNKLSARFQDLAKGVLQPVDPKDGMKVEQSLMISETRLVSIQDTIENLRGQFGHLDDVLERVALLAQDVVSK